MKLISEQWDDNVDYIVEGSVRIAGEKLRVNTKLINIAEDKTVWSDSYDNKLLDIFSVQDEIAGKIVNQLNEKLTISKLDITATKRSSTQNMEAYNLVQEAQEVLLNQKIYPQLLQKNQSYFVSHRKILAHL